MHQRCETKFSTAPGRPWAVVRLHRLSFLLVGGAPEECLVKEIPAEGLGGWRHALHVLALLCPLLLICYGKVIHSCPWRYRSGSSVYFSQTSSSVLCKGSSSAATFLLVPASISRRDSRKRSQAGMA
jgi:hypothetical protein